LAGPPTGVGVVDISFATASRLLAVDELGICAGPSRLRDLYG